MEWFSPLWFLAFVPLTFLILFLFYKRKTQKSTLNYSYISFFKKIPKGFRSHLSGLFLVLKILSMVLIILALARPRDSNIHTLRDVDGVDIMIVLDISDSMLIEDMGIDSRLESAKKTIEEFVNNRFFDRIGLVLFSGEAFTQVPLTLDYPVFLERLKEVQTIPLIKKGTAIGVALANGVGRLRVSEAKSRVVILLTDGENNSGTIDPQTALDLAKGYDLRIYTIGIGKDGMAQIPIYFRDIFGNKRRSYQTIHSKINDQLLTHLALETNGKYFRATEGPALQEIFSEINALEKSKIETTQLNRYQELFQLFLKWALVLFISSLVLKYIFLRVYP